MIKQRNCIFYIAYADVACRITAPAEWHKYFKKLYESSAVLRYSDKRPACCTHIASLTIWEASSDAVKFKFITSPDLMTYEVRASNTPIFLFPSVHQLICRILNILFHLSGGFVLHASTIHIKNKAILFVGESGRGKSTIVDLIRQRHPTSFILSDNSAFIRQQGASFVVYPSPYLEANRLETLQASLPASPPYTIDAVYFPFHAVRNKIIPLSFNEKTRLIQKNSHIPYRPEKLFNKSKINAFGKIVFHFIHTVKISKLEFVNDNKFMYHIL